MIKCALVFYIALIGNSLGLTLKTVSQDNAVVKYNMHGADSSYLPGFCREVADLVEKNIPDLKIKGFEQEVPIQRIEQFLERDQIDIFFCLLKTKDREKRFRYIDIPLYGVNNMLLVKSSDKFATKAELNLIDLKNEGVVLVNKGSSLVYELRRAGVKYSDGGKDDLQIIELLEADRGRFFYGQDASLRFILKNHVKKDKYVLIRVKDSLNSQYVVHSKKLNPKIINDLTRSIQKLKENGTLFKLYQKYIDKSFSYQSQSLLLN